MFRRRFKAGGNVAFEDGAHSGGGMLVEVSQIFSGAAVGMNIFVGTPRDSQTQIRGVSSPLFTQFFYNRKLFRRP